MKMETLCRRIQAALAVLALGLGLWLSVIVRPRVEAHLDAQGRRAAVEAETLHAASELIERNLETAARIDAALAASEQAAAGLVTATGSVARNRQDWSARTGELADLSRELAALGREGSLWLPIEVPLSRRKVLVEEKAMLLKLVKGLTQAGKKLDALADKVKAGARVLDEDVDSALEEAKREIGAARSSLTRLQQSETVLLAALKLQRAESLSAVGRLRALRRGVGPASLLPVVLSLGLLAGALRCGRRKADLT